MYRDWPPLLTVISFILQGLDNLHSSYEQFPEMPLVKLTPFPLLKGTLNPPSTFQPLPTLPSIPSPNSSILSYTHSTIPTFPQTPSAYRPNRTLPLPTLCPLQQFNLLPQHISPERPKRLLNPLPRGRILSNRPSCRCGTSQQPGLPAEEQARDGEEAVGGDVAGFGGAE